MTDLQVKIDKLIDAVGTLTHDNRAVKEKLRGIEAQVDHLSCRRSEGIHRDPSMEADHNMDSASEGRHDDNHPQPNGAGANVSANVSAVSACNFF